MVNKTYIVLGYSLESLVLARTLANDGAHVLFYLTYKAAYPCDDINDYVRKNNVK